jgi:hypothetical protein
MLLENIKTKGTLTLVLADKFGNVREQHEENLVVTTGLAYIASRMKDTTIAATSYMSIGTNTTAALAANTQLGAEIARNTLTSTTLVNTNFDAIQYVATFGTGVGTGAITEAGLHAGSATATANSGTLVARTTFAVINKGANDTLTITWKITIA